MESQHNLLIEFARQHGVFRLGDLEPLGITRRTLRTLVEAGVMARAGRGLYSLADFEATEAHTIVEAVATQSKGVVCLASALSFHGIGTQLPHEVWLAIPQGARIAKRGAIPIRVVVWSPASYEAGIELHQLEGTSVPVYAIAKTVADCFKFRNKVGLDVALEALREVLAERRCTRDQLRLYAKINRVEKVMRPYMEAFSS